MNNSAVLPEPPCLHQQCEAFRISKGPGPHGLHPENQKIGDKVGFHPAEGIWAAKSNGLLPYLR